jgi:hypothetical protein
MEKKNKWHIAVTVIRDGDRIQRDVYSHNALKGEVKDKVRGFFLDNPSEGRLLSIDLVERI